MKKMYLLLLAFVLLVSLAFAGTVSGTLQNDNGYYYIALGSYTSSSSLQTQVFSVYPTEGKHGIWYDNQSWTLDTNKDGQHITITQDNITDGVPLSSLVGDKYTFTYNTDANGSPILTEYNASKHWLVVEFTCTNPEIQGSGKNSLHTSIGFNYNN